MRRSWLFQLSKMGARRRSWEGESQPLSRRTTVNPAQPQQATALHLPESDHTISKMPLTESLELNLRQFPLMIGSNWPWNGFPGRRLYRNPRTVCRMLRLKSIGARERGQEERCGRQTPASPQPRPRLSSGVASISWRVYGWRGRAHSSTASPVSTRRPRSITAMRVLR